MIKKRHFSVELRAAADGPEGVVVGYASVFGNEYPVGWGVKETIQRGAFTDSIKRRGTMPVYLEHDWKAGPIGHLSASEDEKGVRVEAELYLNESERARTVFRALQAGAYSEWSIGFLAEEVTTSAERPELETVTRGDLREASIVNMGANPDTETLEVRNAETAEAPAATSSTEQVTEPETLEATPDLSHLTENISSPAARAILREVISGDSI